MLVVVALGGNALLRRGEPMTAEHQRANVKIAARALAPIAEQHQLVIGYEKGEHHSLDVPGVWSEGMIGDMIEQELANLLPFDRPFATILTMIEVDSADPAFQNPATFIGPVYPKAEADRLASFKGWVFKQDGDGWRRVVASPEPKRIFEHRPIRWLLERNTVVIAAGGGGIPTTYAAGGSRQLVGVECVIDRDLASELLARELGADLFVTLTDADAVYVDWQKPTRRAIRRASPSAIEAWSFAAGSMGPKVAAACRFARKTGKRAAIGSLADLGRILHGQAGTTVSILETGVVFDAPHAVA